MESQPLIAYHLGEAHYSTRRTNLRINDFGPFRPQHRRGPVQPGRSNALQRQSGRRPCSVARGVPLDCSRLIERRCPLSARVHCAESCADRSVLSQELCHRGGHASKLLWTSQGTMLAAVGPPSMDPPARREVTPGRGLIGALVWVCPYPFPTLLQITTDNTISLTISGRSIIYVTAGTHLVSGQWE